METPFEWVCPVVGFDILVFFLTENFLTNDMNFSQDNTDKA